jgi:hypothetical protein
MENGRWGTANYLKSLHTTYGKALPKRDDGHFEKALEFRMREKAHYKDIMQENAKLRQYLDQAKFDHSQLLTDAGNVMTAWETSKLKLSELERLQLSNSKSENVDVPSSSSGVSSVLQHEDPGRSANVGIENNEQRCSAGSNDEVSGEILSTKLPDSRGQADEHPTEGRQP